MVVELTLFPVSFPARSGRKFAVVGVCGVVWGEFEVLVGLVSPWVFLGALGVFLLRIERAGVDLICCAGVKVVVFCGYVRYLFVSSLVMGFLQA